VLRLRISAYGDIRGDKAGVSYRVVKERIRDKESKEGEKAGVAQRLIKKILLNDKEKR
jgi:hypothetical protein